MISNTITKEIHVRVMSLVYDILDKAEKLYPYHGFRNLILPVTYRTDMKQVAGLAYCTSIKIELNADLFLENLESFFVSTIPHEVAHIIATKVFPDAKQNHGPEWKSVMRSLGYVPTARHSFAPTATMKSNSLFRYTCSCDKEFFLSKIMHNKINRGNDRYHTVCKTKIVFNPL